MPDAPLPPLPPAGRPPWRTTIDDVLRRLPVRPGTFAGLVLAVVVVVVVGALLWRPAPSATLARLPSATPAAAEPTDAAGPSGPSGIREGVGEEVVVDVAGAVARPGLVRLRMGDRVADALAAAGGVTAEADPSGVNQARVVADGEQVRVPRLGEPAPPALAGGATAGGGTTGPIDLNRASATELDVLPGVGPATAAAIVTWRDTNGRFRRVDDLLEVPGIGPSRLERLRPLVRV